jgi:glycerol-3-phosphate acyltransferase PlsX
VTAPGPIRIALDGMGGDHAPAAPVTAALTVAAEGIEVLLTGDAAVLREELGRQGAAEPAGVEVIHAPERIGSSEDGARAVRAKPDSSVAVACRLAGEGRAQGAVSAAPASPWWRRARRGRWS